MSGDMKDTLKKRLDQNYTAFMESLQGKTAAELIAMAPEITAAQILHEELLDSCDKDDMEFLLLFNDPLELVRGFWESEITGYDHGGEIGHMLWEIRDRELYDKDQLARPEKEARDIPSPDEPLSSGVREITTDDLRKMEGQEGLVLQGCGGDLREWVDGINGLLTDAGILRDGSRFENVSSFQHDGLTCLLFPFEDVKLDVGRLAMWRLQTHEQFGGTWLSDYVPNRLGGFVHEQVQRKPQMQLVGEDGNIFSILGRASGLLKDAGMKAQSDEMFERVTACGDYDKALHIISEYVETELSPRSQNQQKSQKKKGKNAHER